MGDYQPPQGPPLSHYNPQSNDRGHVHFRDRVLGSNNPFRSQNAHTHVLQGPGQSSSEQPPAYEAPQGPPPTWSDKKQSLSEHDQYAPPAGPPPDHQSKEGYDQPPPGPPPSQRAHEPEPPPYDPWLAVPDNTLLPPPPSFKEERSPTANATYNQAARGHAWCRENPLWQPCQHAPQVLSKIQQGDVHLTCPPNTHHVSLQRQAAGRTRVRVAAAKDNDVILLSDLPLYTACTGEPRTVYFELQVISMGDSRSQDGDAGIAIGFVAPPYPAWRLPGWHRASIGVHGDDGRRYVDDSYGGKDFTSAFRKNDVVGIGMIHSAPRYQGGKNQCEIFFTHDGKKDGGWNLHEERDRDAEEGDVFGLEGQHDLLAAVGCFGPVEFEARFRRQDWLFKA